MFSATPIAGYVNQLHIKNMFKINRCSKMLKKMFKNVFLGSEIRSKMCRQPGQGTLKLTFSRMDRWNNPIFVCWYQFREAKKHLNEF